MVDATTKYRLDALEKSQGDSNDRLDRVLETLLPELKAEVISLKTRINVLSIINVGSIIIGIIVGRIIQ